MKADIKAKRDANIEAAQKARHEQQAMVKELGRDPETSGVQFKTEEQKAKWDKLDAVISGKLGENVELRADEAIYDHQQETANAAEKLAAERDAAAKATAAPRAGGGKAEKLSLGELLYSITQAAGQGNRAGHVTLPLVAVDQEKCDGSRIYRNVPKEMAQWTAKDTGNQIIAENLAGNRPVVGGIEYLDLGIPGLKEMLDIKKSDIAGGLAVDTLPVQERMFDVASILGVANVINTMSGTIINRRTRTVIAGAATTENPQGGQLATIIPEAGMITAVDPTFGSEELSAFKMGYRSDYSYESLLDMTPGDFAMQITADMGRAMALGIDYFLAVGTNVAQPQGLTETTNTMDDTAGRAGKPAAASLIDMKYKVGSGYTGRMFATKFANLAEIRKLGLGSDSTNPLFRVDDTGQWDGYIDGDPCITSPGFPEWGNNKKAIVYGDIRTALDVRLAGPMRLDRSTEVAWVNDQVAWRVLQRVDSVLKDHHACVSLQGKT